jgi:hypothetical protein
MIVSKKYLTAEGANFFKHNLISFSTIKCQHEYKHCMIRTSCISDQNASTYYFLLDSVFFFFCCSTVSSVQNIYIYISLFLFYCVECTNKIVRMDLLVCCSFDEFLMDMKQSKRKNIRQERKKVGLAFQNIVLYTQTYYETKDIS